MKLRTLVVEVVTKWAGEARLKKAKELTDQTAQSLRVFVAATNEARSAFGNLADSVAADAGRMAKAIRGLGGVSMPRVGGGSTGGGGGRRPTRDPLDDAIRRSNRAESMRSGFDAGKTAVNDAQKALSTFATASDRAKARVADLTSQVERNRREMADIKAEALRTGDADGTLAARMKGLSVATGQTSVELGKARRELRALDGGLIDTIKSAANFQARMQAVSVAAGNLLSAGVSRALHGIGGALLGSADGAIKFESAMADVKKVLSGPDLQNFDVLNKGVLDLSKNIGIAPTEVAALTASLAQSGIAGDELLKTAEDASKLSVAFGISGEDAGQALAKLRTGLGLSRDGVNSLAGTINVLSNNLAATAPEIVDAVQRVGSIGKANNISAQSVAALTTAMIASGAGADVAATGTKNFILALTAGAAATKKEREAFTALGLTAEEVNARIVKGGTSAEEAVRDVVTRIGKLRAEERSPVLRELFGKESLGAIGPLATNIDLLTKSFGLAGDAAAAAGSVEKEFAARSSTTEQAINKLKASVSVLAIEFGNQLLPYINEIVAFLTSPEGQEWGREAVAKAAEVAKDFAKAVGTVAQGLGFLVEKIGGTGVAVSSLGTLIAALAGPWGIAGAAAAAAIAIMVSGIGKVASMIPALNDAVMGIGSSEEVTAKNLENLRETMAEDDQRSLGEVTDLDRARRVLGQDVDSPIDSRSGPTFGYGPPPTGGAPPPAVAVTGLAAARAHASGKVDLSGMSEEEKQAAFADLSARRKTLKPSEQKLLRALSKDLDKRIPTGSGDSSFTEEQKKALAEQRRLQGDLGGVIDENRTGFGQRFLELGKHSEEAKLNRITAGRGGLLTLLEQGRERKKGVLGGATNELDRAVESMLEGPTPLGISGSRSGSGAVAGPAISNRYEIHNSAHINQEIHVEGRGDTTPERIRSSARTVANETITGWQEAAAVFTSGST